MKGQTATEKDLVLVWQWFVTIYVPGNLWCTKWIWTFGWINVYDCITFHLPLEAVLGLHIQQSQLVSKSLQKIVYEGSLLNDIQDLSGSYAFFKSENMIEWKKCFFNDSSTLNFKWNTKVAFLDEMLQETTLFLQFAWGFWNLWGCSSLTSLLQDPYVGMYLNINGCQEYGKSLSEENLWW